MPEHFAVSLARLEDLPALTQIYNQAIAAGSMTADLEPVNLENRRLWFQSHTQARRPIYVARDSGHSIVGYASLSDYREGRAAVKTTAEVSIYVALERTNQGIGSCLLEHALQQASDLSIEQLIAIVLACNTPSLALFQRFGFETWGRLKGVARIHGKPIDHLYLGRAIRIPDQANP